MFHSEDISIEVAQFCAALGYLQTVKRCQETLKEKYTNVFKEHTLVDKTENRSEWWPHNLFVLSR
jgi:hypothetical protein